MARQQCSQSVALATDADVSPRRKKPQRWISPPKGVIPLRPRARAAADRVHMHKWPGREEGSGEKVGGRQKGTQSQSICKIIMKKSLFKKLRGCWSGVLPVSRPLSFIPHEAALVSLLPNEIVAGLNES